MVFNLSYQAKNLRMHCALLNLYSRYRPLHPILLENFENKHRAIFDQKKTLELGFSAGTLGLLSTLERRQ